MDIMRHGADVEVLAPDSLRQAVHRRLGEAASRYSVLKACSRAHSLR